MAKENDVNKSIGINAKSLKYIHRFFVAEITKCKKKYKLDLAKKIFCGLAKRRSKQEFQTR